MGLDNSKNNDNLDSCDSFFLGYDDVLDNILLIYSIEGLELEVRLFRFLFKIKEENNVCSK